MHEFKTGSLEETFRADPVDPFANTLVAASTLGIGLTTLYRVDGGRAISAVHWECREQPASKTSGQTSRWKPCRRPRSRFRRPRRRQEAEPGTWCKQFPQNIHRFSLISTLFSSPTFLGLIAAVGQRRRPEEFRIRSDTFVLDKGRLPVDAQGLRYRSNAPHRTC